MLLQESADFSGIKEVPCLWLENVILSIGLWQNLKMTTFFLAPNFALVGNKHIK